MSKAERFALSNPISIMLGKEREEFTREDLIKVFIEKQLERITFHYTAIDGKLKELKIPITSRKQIEWILTEGERVDGSSLFKKIVDPGESDLYVVPVYKSAFLSPFDNGSMDFMCRFFTRDGNLAYYASDNILHNAHELLKKNTGLELHTHGEIEFYLIGNYENKTYPITRQQGYHSSAPFAKSGPMINEMMNYITQIFGNVKYAHNEVGFIESVESHFSELNGKSAEQVEIEFLPSHVEDSADSMVLASWIIRNVAYKHNFIATFSPKLEIGHAGNGLHFHMLLNKNGKNVMTDAEGELSDEAMMLIGGLCHYAPSLTAFGNMVSASYLRLVPNQEAPTKVCWSGMNRSALIRVPLAWTKIENLAGKINPQQKDGLKIEHERQTVELRSPDGSANAHLLLAGIVLAAEWGLSNKKDSISLAKNCHVSVNIHSTASMEHLAELATSCVESAEKLLQVRSMYERNNIFPTNVITYIANVLTNENDRNLNNSLMALPEDEKQFQSRRIMHRDLHKH